MPIMKEYYEQNMEVPNNMLVDARVENFEKVTVFGHTMLFTNLRVMACTVPEGYYKYSVRHDDDCQGIPCEIALGVMVNHWGDIISNKPIRFDVEWPNGNKSRFLDENAEDWNYEWAIMTLEEYMNEFKPEKEEIE